MPHEDSILEKLAELERKREQVKALRESCEKELEHIDEILDEAKDQTQRMSKDVTDAGA